MDRIHGIVKETDHPFLNYYRMDVRHKNGRESEYYMASRAKSPEDLKAVSHQNRPDGIIIYGVYGENKDRVVLVKQYRYPLGDYVYEFPAGLVEDGEDFVNAGIREFREETGLHFDPVPADDMYTLPRFTTVGMTDESCATVYGYASGTPDESGQEASEDIQIVLADRNEVRRILKEENVAIMCAYMLMHFLNAEGDPLQFVKMNSLDE